MKRVGECLACGECCKTLRITTPLDNMIAQHGSIEEAARYYSFRGFVVEEFDEEKNAAFLSAPIPCDQLTEEGGCKLHNQPELKPVICHRYPWFPDDIEGCGYSFR